MNEQEENLIRETDASLEQEREKLHILIIEVTSWYFYAYQRSVVVVVAVKHLQKSRKCGKTLQKQQ